MDVALLAAPLGNLDDFDVGTRAIERVAIASDDLARRILRIETRLGSIGLRLEGDVRVRDGDVIVATTEIVIALAVVPDDVLVLRPRTIAEALALAHAIGNRHLPMQIAGESLVVRYDPLVEALFREAGAAFARESRGLARPFRHAHAPHGHA